MHPYALRDELDLFEAATLLAYPKDDRELVNQWRNVLEEAIKRRELPAHDADSDVVRIAWTGITRPVRGLIKPHIRQEDLQRFCAKRRIQLPGAKLLPPLVAAAQDILSRRLAWFEDYCRQLPDADLYGWQKRDFLSELRRLPLFKGLQSPHSWDKFWDETLPVLKRVRDARRAHRKK